MKIITILLLMITNQILAEERLSVDAEGVPEELTFTVKQCNQIANISKRTIKAAISGVPIAEVTEFFAELPSGSEQLNRIGHDCPTGPGSYNLESCDDAQRLTGNMDKSSTVMAPPKEFLGLQHTNNIRAYYKAVNQIKTKYGQVREQDRVRLNNRVELKLIECREMTRTAEGMYIDDASSN